MHQDFLPVSLTQARARGWEAFDFVLISGDAYVDHPTFGAALIGRVLESRGFRVGILPQPNWRDVHDFRRLGQPALGFLITSGNLDSMVSHYTAAKKRRKKDAYSPGARSGLRPDRAAIVYANRAKEAFGDVPIILGGLEASLRRLAHYDYWDDNVRRSILLDARADLVVYGMGERQIVEIAEALAAGIPISMITYVRGTVYRSATLDDVYRPEMLPAYDTVVESKKQYARSFAIQYRNTDAVTATALVEPYRDQYVIQNPPAQPLSTEELDSIYLLPFTKTYHPMYTEDGGIPALQEVQFSLASSRGCFGGCSFCSLHFHQGRTIQARSIPSIVEEAKELTTHPDFKGYIHDVGGPTANFRIPACSKQLNGGVCSDRACLGPDPCPSLQVDHQEYLTLLQTLRGLPGVKKVFVRSGLRYDYLLYDEDESFFRELCQHHISGQLKVAPEHVASSVLRAMGKPERDVYDRFVRKYQKTNKELGRDQYLVPYFMSSHPGSDLAAAIELAEYVRDMGYTPEQVQDFYPTPGTLSTCMYYTGIHPLTEEKIYTAKDPHEKAMQRALVQYREPRNRKLVLEALTAANRKDLIGSGPDVLIKNPPTKR